MEYERDFTYLIRHRLIWRRGPLPDDPPTKTFWWGKYYEDGTYGCYNLFASRAKISTYKSLKWHLYVLWYLNPELDQEDFDSLVRYICLESAGFITFTVRPALERKISRDIYMQDLERPPPNGLRKIIFNDNCKLTTKEKMSIVGSMTGRSGITESDLYEAMLMIKETNSKITITKLAKALGVSTRTIHRNMTEALREEKTVLNKTK